VPTTETCLLWFRQDLRLADNAALQAALSTGLPIICIFIWDETTPTKQQIGSASKWWLHHSLVSLDAALQERNNKLLYYRGKPEDILMPLIQKENVKTVFWNRCYDAHSINRDKKIKANLINADVEVESFNSHLLYEPWDILNQAGKPYKVFTPFWRKGCLPSGREWNEIHAAPKKIPTVKKFPRCDTLASWELLPYKPNWASEFETFWHPGESGAQKRLANFIDHGLRDYKEGRNFPAQQNVSGLSPHLHWGEIAPWRIWQSIEIALSSDKRLLLHNVENFQSELGWREFSYYLLYHFPSLPSENFRSEFNNFPWESNKKLLRAWQRGQTGYPLVDAGMRQLWQTGWMHNRVRMVAGSFLVKHLRLHWHHGEHWFWDTLVDADLASNSASWQWVAGCGADAAPYFRIFNPVLQSEKFDAQGEYIRCWVPELAELENKYIHAPWNAPSVMLEKAEIILGKTYPLPVVDHNEARAAALDAYKNMRR